MINLYLLNLKKEEENKIENGGQKSSASIQKSLNLQLRAGVKIFLPEKK